MAGMDEVFADAQAIKATDEEVASISIWVRKALALKEEIDALTATLQERTAEHRAIIEKELPEAMDAANCGEFKDAESGKKIKIKDEVHASISQGNKPKAHEWMRMQGHEDLIKNQLVFPLDRGKDNIASEIEKLIRETYGIQGVRNESIHPQTLKAFCKEQISQGTELPRELLGVFIRRVAEIK